MVLKCRISHLNKKDKINLLKMNSDSLPGYARTLCSNLFEPRHGKTGFLPMRKQRRRSAVQ